MNKLTAEKCREFIDIFKSLEKEGHLALASEYHLQAYEKALPVLEQQEKGDDGWIEWSGGECPVAESCVVEVKFRSGKVKKPAAAEEYLWTNGYGDLAETGADIIAYRVVQQERERGEEE